MLHFIIHPCDPTLVIYYLICPCDIVVRITYLISHSSSLSYNTVIKDISGWVLPCIINTKLPSCVDIIRSTSLGFPSWCPESTRPTDTCFQGLSCENLVMYGGLYQHTRWFCICITCGKKFKIIFTIGGYKKFCLWQHAMHENQRKTSLL